MSWSGVNAVVPGASANAAATGAEIGMDLTVRG